MFTLIVSAQHSTMYSFGRLCQCQNWGSLVPKKHEAHSCINECPYGPPVSSKWLELGDSSSRRIQKVQYMAGGAYILSSDLVLKVTFLVTRTEMVQ